MEHPVRSISAGFSTCQMIVFHICYLYESSVDSETIQWSCQDLGESSFKQVWMSQIRMMPSECFYCLNLDKVDTSHSTSSNLLLVIIKI